MAQTALANPPPHSKAPGRLGAWASGLVVGLLGALSRPALRRLAGAIGALAYALRIRREVTLDNLRHAFPELTEVERRRIARGAYFHMALSALEAIAHSSPKAKAPFEITIDDPALLERVLAANKGLLVATGHFGNWELLGEVLSKQGYPLHAVVRPLKGALNHRIVQARLQSGLGLISPKGAIAKSAELVRQGGIVCMLVDQVISAKHGVFVPFFGRLASTNPALSIAAQRSGAPVLVAMGAREGDGLRVYLEGPFELSRELPIDEAIARHTAEVTRAIERQIRRHPEQWLWLHRRWKVKPPSDREPGPQAQ